MMLLLGASCASADVISERPDSVSVTLYHEVAVDTAALLSTSADFYDDRQGLGFITETRTIDLPAGPSTIRFRGVASTMIAESATIEGLPEQITERNFDYNLLSPSSLLANSVGKIVRLIRTNPKTGKETEQQATIRATSGGVVLDVDGHYEALHCGGPPARLVFDTIPEGLTSTPTLSVKVVSPVARRYTIKLAYIATRLNWSADYTVHVNPDGDTLDLTGRITLANFTDTNFLDAPTDVIAGRLNRNADEEPTGPAWYSSDEHCWPLDVTWSSWTTFMRLHSYLMGAQTGLYSSSPVTAVSQQEIRPEEIGDYKLYHLPEATSVAAQQTKQVQFLYKRDVKFERVYACEIALAPDDDPANNGRAIVEYRIQNLEKTGLGVPLPGGTISMMETGRLGAPVFTGQAIVDDMPVGSPVFVDSGGALDIPVEHRVVASRVVGSGETPRVRDTLEVGVENRKPIPIQFELFQDTHYPGTRIISEDRDHTNDRGSAIWHFALAAGERATVRYTVEYLKK